MHPSWHSCDWVCPVCRCCLLWLEGSHLLAPCSGVPQQLCSIVPNLAGWHRRPVPCPVLQEQRDLTTKLEGSYGDQDVFVPLVDKCFKAQVRSAVGYRGVA